MLNVVIISSQNNHIKLDDNIHVSYVKEFSGILDIDQIDTLIIDITKKQDIYNSLTRIRQSKEHFLLPVYTIEAFDSDLSDGIFQDESLEQAKAILELCNELKNIKTDWQSRLLYFLYTRPNLHLKPIKDLNHSEYFYHELVEVFSEKQQMHTSDFLNSLCEDQVLSKTQLIQTLFVCNKCSDAHVFFSDHCPNCNSFEIEYCDFVHCYSCGNISPEKEYIYQNSLKCPNCFTMLRHISVDYDIPLENYQCRQCEHQFDEPNVISTCMSCGNKSPTEKLSKKYVYEYELTDFGKKYIYENQSATLKIFDKINYVNPTIFYNQVAWLLKMAKRDSCFQFSLIYFKIRIDLSSERVIQIARILKKALRDTDILTRVDERIIWVILPNTDKEGAMLTIDRIKTQLLEQTRHNKKFYLLHSSDLNLKIEIEKLVEQYNKGLE
jgi:hypothetical protein